MVVRVILLKKLKKKISGDIRIKVNLDSNHSSMLKQVKNSGMKILKGRSKVYFQMGKRGWGLGTEGFLLGFVPGMRFQRVTWPASNICFS